jgi:hypothetical protein
MLLYNTTPWSFSGFGFRARGIWSLHKPCMHGVWVSVLAPPLQANHQYPGEAANGERRMANGG